MVCFQYHGVLAPVRGHSGDEAGSASSSAIKSPDKLAMLSILVDKFTTHQRRVRPLVSDNSRAILISDSELPIVCQISIGPTRLS